MPARIPITGTRPVPEAPQYGGLGEAGWARGQTFLDLVTHDALADPKLEEAFAALDVDAEMSAFFASYPRRVRVLVLGNLDQIDTRFNVAQAEHLFVLGKNIWMRFFPAAENQDLVRIFVGAQHELPHFVFFGDDRLEFARWGPRPGSLRTFESDMKGTSIEQRDARRREFYVAERGRALAGELRQRLEPRLGA